MIKIPTNCELSSLASLAGMIDHALELRGYPREKRSFRAHITLARVSSQAAAQFLARSAASVPVSASFEAAGITLFQSDLRRAGPRYSPLAHFTFGQAATTTDDGSTRTRGEPNGHTVNDS